MRVITGIAKHRRLSAPEGLDTRPTSDMVKEAIFSILQFEIEGAQVLDLFAGSGQLGIEALSRGARSCVFVDNSRQCQAVVRENLKHTGLAENARLVGTDVDSFLHTASGPYDIAFVDPPYRSDIPARILPLLAQKMSPGGIILCETDRADQLPEQVAGFTLHKEYRYGKTKVTVYRSSGTEV